eukprot:XP_001695421.1 predicted protein [Chlamydomonas reinhardtii]
MSSSHQDDDQSIARALGLEQFAVDEEDSASVGNFIAPKVLEAPRGVGETELDSEGRHLQRSEGAGTASVSPACTTRSNDHPIATAEEDEAQQQAAQAVAQVLSGAQAVPLNVPPWDFLQLLYGAALNRLADPSPFLAYQPDPAELLQQQRERRQKLIQEHQARLAQEQNKPAAVPRPPRVLRRGPDGRFVMKEAGAEQEQEQEQGQEQLEQAPGAEALRQLLLEQFPSLEAALASAQGTMVDAGLFSGAVAGAPPGLGSGAFGLEAGAGAGMAATAFPPGLADGARMLAAAKASLAAAAAGGHGQGLGQVHGHGQAAVDPHQQEFLDQLDEFIGHMQRPPEQPQGTGLVAMALVAAAGGMSVAQEDDYDALEGEAAPIPPVGGMASGAGAAGSEIAPYGAEVTAAQGPGPVGPEAQAGVAAAAPTMPFALHDTPVGFSPADSLPSALGSPTRWGALLGAPAGTERAGASSLAAVAGGSLLGSPLLRGAMSPLMRGLGDGGGAGGGEAGGLAMPSPMRGPLPSPLRDLGFSPLQSPGMTPIRSGQALGGGDGSGALPQLPPLPSLMQLPPPAVPLEPAPTGPPPGGSSRGPSPTHAMAPGPSPPPPAIMALGPSPPLPAGPLIANPLRLNGPAAFEAAYAAAAASGILPAFGAGQGVEAGGGGAVGVMLDPQSVASVAAAAAAAAAAAMDAAPTAAGTGATGSGLSGLTLGSAAQAAGAAGALALAGQAGPLTAPLALHAPGATGSGAAVAAGPGPQTQAAPATIVELPPPAPLPVALPPPGPDVPLAARVGAVYAVYCLYGTQLCSPRVRVYVPLPLLGSLAATVREAADKGVKDAVAAMRSVLVSNPVLRQALLHLRMALPGVTDTAALQRLCDTVELQSAGLLPDMAEAGAAAGRAGQAHEEDEDVAVAARQLHLPGVPARLLQKEAERRQRVASVADRWLSEQDRQMRREAGDVSSAAGAGSAARGDRPGSQPGSSGRPAGTASASGATAKASARPARGRGSSRANAAARTARAESEPEDDLADVNVDIDLDLEAALEAEFSRIEAHQQAGTSARTVPADAAANIAATGQPRQQKAKPAAAKPYGTAPATAKAQPGPRAAAAADAASGAGGTKSPKPPQRLLHEAYPGLDVVCGGTRGRLDTRARTVTCACTACEHAGASSGAVVDAPVAQGLGSTVVMRQDLDEDAEVVVSDVDEEGDDDSGAEDAPGTGGRVNGTAASANAARAPGVGAVSGAAPDDEDEDDDLEDFNRFFAAVKDLQ